MGMAKRVGLIFSVYVLYVTFFTMAFEFDDPGYNFVLSHFPSIAATSLTVFVVGRLAKKYDL